MKKTTRRNPNLRYNKPMLLRLEPRIMFDGAAVDTTVDVATGHDGGSMDPAMAQIQEAMNQSFGAAATGAPQDTNSSASTADQGPVIDGQNIDNANGDLPDASADLPLLELTGGSEAQQQLLSDAAELANAKLVDWVKSDDFRAQAADIFSADANSAAWEAQLDALRESIINGDYSIRVEIRTNEEMQGLLGVFSATGTTGQPTIYMNADYLATANATQVSQVLIEEIGHAIDNQLNSGMDSQGDEGHALAALLTTGNADLTANQIRDDHHVLNIDGTSMEVESAGPYNIAQTHYVPMPENQIWSGIQNIYSSSSDNKIESIIAITATSNQTYVVYDHWEDGYEADINNPVGTSTRIWYYDNGTWTDVKTGTTLAEGVTVGNVTAYGQSLILRNQVNKNSMGDIDFDGGDKIGSTKAISVTRAGWDTKIGTIVGGAVNIIDVGNAGKEYVIPIGSDTAEAPKIGGTSILQKNSLFIMAYEDNTTVTVDLGGGKTITRTLNEGQSLFIKGLASGGTFKAGTGLNDAEAVVNDGTRITSNKAIGVNMLSGSNTSQNRWYGIAPTESWGSSYYAPVASIGGATSHIYLHNDNGSAIDVKYETRNADGTFTTQTVNVAANSTKVVAMPASAGRFYTENGDKFYAVATVDPTTSRDWSYSLVAERTLTDKFVVAWGPGNGNPAGAGGAIPGKNGSPVWLTAADNTYIYVNSATVELKDAQGNTIAKDNDKSTVTVTAFKVDRLQSYRLRDTSDSNQTGLMVYTLDGALITAAWGEDATVADTGNPYLDMGTTISPYPDYVLDKKAAEIINNAREEGVIEAGDQVKYTITLTNRAVIELLNMSIKDSITPAGSSTYIANSLELTSYDENGKRVWVINAAAGTKTWYLADGSIDTTKGTNGVETDTSLTGSDFDAIMNTGNGYSVVNELNRDLNRKGLQIGAYIEFTYRVTINETINKSLADANFVISNSVQLTSPEITKEKVNKVDLSPTITDGEVFFISGSGGSVVTSYEPGNEIWIRVTDNDQNRDKDPVTGIETLTVTLTNTTTGEKETFILTETGVNTGVFEGKVSTVRGTGNVSDDPGDGSIKLKRGDELKVEYTDPITGNSGDLANGIDNPTNPGIDNADGYTNGGVNNNVKTLVVEDSGISVNDILVNEASPYGVFTVQGVQGQIVSLELIPGTADSNVDYTDSLEYYNGTTWVAYTPGDKVTITNADGTLLVRNPIINDSVFEGAETYQLKVTPYKTDGVTPGSSTTGTATILDDGTGDIYDPATGGKTPSDPGDPAYVPHDHDRFPQVDNPVVNEATGKVVFTVTTQPGDTVTKLELANGTAIGGTAITATEDNTGGSPDYENDVLEYSVDGGANWITLEKDGASWKYTDNSPFTSVKVDTGTLLVRIKVQDDQTYEQSETFTLTAETITGGKATGTATIKDDGTGDIQDPNTGDPLAPADPGYPAGGLDDDQGTAIQVNNPVVNEASGHVVFEVKNTSGSDIGVNLALDNGMGSKPATGSPSGPIGAGEQGSKDYRNDSFEYWDGSAWVEYTSEVTIAASGTLYVRVAIYNDTTYEGAETFDLVVTPQSASAVTGTATILDDGTGDIFNVPDPDSDPGIPGAKVPTDPNDPAYQPRDDDRTPVVNNPIVNEGSPYIVFEVTTTPKAVIGSLVFNDGTATGGTTSPADGSVDYGSNALQYSLDGGANWTNYTSGPITAPTDGKVLVRTTIVNDDDYEVSENFRLTVTLNDINTGQPTGNSATGVGTILDDGRGTIWVPEDKDQPNGKLTPITPETPTGSIPGTVDPAVVKFDDDRPVSVNSPTVNEGSGYIVFEVGGIAGTPIKSLVLGDGTAIGGSAVTGTQGAVDFNNSLPLQYFNGTTWVDFVEGTGTNIPAGGTLLVRVAIFNDTKFEGSETFTLKATTQGGKEATGTGTIKDDGTGTIWEPVDPSNPGNPGGPTNPLIPVKPTDPSVPGYPGHTKPSFDDDRGINITNGGKFSGGVLTESAIKENGVEMFFKVTGVESGEVVNLSYTSTGETNPATTSGFFMDYSTDGGTTWTRYNWNGSTGNRPTAPTGGEILVRVNIDSENDEPNVVEPDETFKLTASYASNSTKTATGTGTITDKSVGAPKIIVTDMNGGSENGDATVHEKGLTSTSDDSEKTTGTINLEAEDGITSIYLGDDAFTREQLLNWQNVPVEVETSMGTLKVTNVQITEGDETTPKKMVLTYEYTLKENQYHYEEEVPTTETFDTIELAVSDGDRSVEGSLIVRIVDDTPTATNDERGVIEGSTLVVGPAGGVLNHPTTGDDPGADGWATGGGVVGVVAGTGGHPTTGVGTSITGTHGKLTLNADGSFTYENTSGNPGDTDVFTYTVRDSDGDETTATLTITIKQQPQDDTRRGDEDTPVTGNVIKNGQPGDVPDVDPNDPEPLKVIEVSVGGVSKPVNPGVPTVFELTEGKLTFNSDGSYEFVPTPDWNGKVPEITYEVAYGEGATDSTSTAKLNITIDPVKDAEDDSTNTMTGTPITTTVLGNDSFSNPGNSVSIVGTPEGGTLVVNPDRTITFTPDPGFTGYATYTYRVTTPEGIWEDAIVTIRVDSLPPFVDPGVPGEHLPPYVEPPVPQPEQPSPHLGLTDPEMPPYEVGKDPFTDWDYPDLQYDLLLEKKIPDQPLEGGKEMEITIPKDTFRHTDPTAKLTLVAAQLDGSPLPDWLMFDSAKGSFSGTPPAGFSGEILVRVVARDGQGRQVETVVRMGDKVAESAMPPYEAGKDPAMGEGGKLGEHELLLEKKIPDQPLEEGGEIDFLVPRDTFRHTDPAAKLTLSAAMVDGSPLPEWLKFDAKTGSFSGKVPAGQKGELLIKVIAKDEAGRQVETMVRISDQVDPSYAVSIDSGLMVNGEHVLQVAKGVPELLMPFEADGAASIEYVIPMDAFVHTDPNAKVELSAMMIDGSELPEWLKFDPKTGKFKGIPPKGFKGELQIKVIARDSEGRQAETILRIKVGEQKAEQKEVAKDRQVSRGKPSLTSVLKTQGSWAWKAERDRLVSLANELDRIKASFNKAG